MEGKYSHWTKFYIVRAYRMLLRCLLRTTVSWQPISNAEPGYSAVIGCKHELADLVRATLRFLALQDSPSLRQTVIVFDHTPTPELESLASDLSKQYPQLNVTYAFYSSWQHLVAHKLGLPWVYCWMSWCIGLSKVKTKHALLQDLDAMLLAPHVLETRFKLAQQMDVEWFGDKAYSSNGIYKEDNLATTWEMILDAQYVRSRFSPVHLFQHVCLYKGRSVDFDITLWAQTQGGRTANQKIPRTELVHPAQVIHQFTELQHRQNYISPEANTLFFIPYFLELGGQEGLVIELTSRIQDSNPESIPFF
jgi:hypothetical protein